MKRLVSLLITALVTISASAQVPDGFYRVKCKETGRYLAVHNSYVNTESAKNTGQVDMQSLETVAGFDNVVNDPGSVLYLRNISGGYAIEAQGFTTDRKQLKLNLIAVGDAYRIEARIVYDGEQYIRYLRDYGEDGKSYVTTDAIKSPNQNWYVIPISDDNYFGLKGDVKVGNSYYTNTYATFPFELGEGMKAYAVNTLTDNSCTLKDIGSVVPAKTPVVIECVDDDAAANKVKPLTESSATVGDNKLTGVIFCYPVLTPTGQERRSNPAWNCVDYDAAKMRILDVADNKLCFVASGSLAFIPANSVYLPVATGTPDIIPTDGTTGITGVKNDATKANKAKGTFTLNGVRLPDGGTPQKGMYIQDGKVVVIKP
jgi:hypothetical protein